MKRFILGLLFLLNLSINANSNEIISQIETNWNQIETMSGNFKQEDSDGIVSYGNFYFLKPYQSKFIYKDRTENIITNERLLIIVDHNDYKIESYAIGSNVLKKLLSNNLSINEQFDIINFKNANKEYVLQLRVKNNDNNQINISFDKNNLDIKKWEIYDEFQNKTVLEFTKIKKNIFISQNLFVVKYK